LFFLRQVHPGSSRMPARGAGMSSSRQRGSVISLSLPQPSAAGISAFSQSFVEPTGGGSSMSRLGDIGSVGASLQAALAGVVACSWAIGRRRRSHVGLGSASRLGCRSADREVVAASPWEVLGLRRDAPKQDIKARFKQLAATEHPDKRPGDETASARFSAINAAYQQLMDGPIVDKTPDAGRKAQRPNVYNEGFDSTGASMKDAPIRSFQGVFLLVFLVAFSVFLYFRIEDLFPDPQPVGNEADLIRLGLKDSEDVKRFYKQYEDKYGPRTMPLTDRSQLEQMEQSIDGADVVNFY